MDKYYVESPGQIINAMESICYRKKPWIMIVRFNGSESNDLQIKNVLSFYEKHEIMELNNGIVNINSFINFICSSITVFFKFGMNNFFVGCHKSRFLQMFKLLRLPMTLLDDGVATFSYDYNIRNTKLTFKDRLLNRKPIMNLFTSLDINKLSESQKIVRNKFPYLRSLLKDKDTSSDVLFFGAKYIEVNLLTFDQYLSLLTKAIKKFGGKTVYYIPHRGENKANFKYYEKLGYQVKITSLPSELELVTMPSKPDCVAGFFTASLLTSHLLYPDIEIVTFQVPNLEIPKDARNLLDAIYGYYSNFSNIVKL